MIEVILYNHKQIENKKGYQIMTNKHLQAAKYAKNDEFYTQISDIEEELRHYTKYFKDKVVYCNCDDPIALGILMKASQKCH